ncbi:MAG: restriction endonuclease subunit S, partial [Rhodobacteraceae bacterium]|nr:restriction endonuclease subunit S [Paracoccaceae bacterium]
GENRPRLRFPEFRNSNDWPIKPLGEIFDEINETGFPGLSLLSVTGQYGVIFQKDLNRRTTANLNKGKYLRVIPGDIVYDTMRMWEGRSARTSLEGLVSPAYTVCRPKTETDGFFFAYYFKTSAMIDQFRKYSQGLVKDTLSLKYYAFSQIPAAFPSLIEQQKIANCLGSLDDLIATSEQKLEALKQYKQGLMQNLFPNLVKK